MCTATFVPVRSGFYFGMNRDELKTRAVALPPTLHVHKGFRSLYPHEPNGGTWIGVNNCGLMFALLNWQKGEFVTGRNRVSRGTVVPRLLRADSLDQSIETIAGLRLRNMNSFRLLLISIADRKLIEGSWDGKRWKQDDYPWECHHWFSSGYDETAVQTVRQTTTAQASRQKTAQTLGWIKRLHRSHKPKRSAFSICMHRSDAETVSYTEVRVLHLRARMVYVSGPPCRKNRPAVTELLLKPPAKEGK